MKFKKLFCKHEFESLHQEKFIGVTLNWALTRTNEYEDTYKCKKCGVVENRRYIYWGGKK